MPKPSPQDYNEAIQSPRICFADPVLRSGKPVLTPLGLPRPISGGFASVYQVVADGRDWAVRCFLSEVPDQEVRYAAISAHLAAAPLPYTVPFEFIPRGILVKGQWTPIVKMQWVRGVGLTEWIAANVNKPAALAALAARWLEMVGALEAAGIAHGDLQHGNVLVTGASLCLVDYDGMFVPALAGRKATEVGHRNYQHPQRTTAQFDATLDRFSGWIIYLSLLALSHDPLLWSHTPRAGDECILFRREDFERPHASAALKLLTMHPDPAVRAIGVFCETLFYASLAAIPAVTSSSLRTAPAAAAPTAPPAHASWLDDYLPRPAPPRHETPTEGGEGGANWLLDHVGPITPPAPRGYTQPPPWLRACGGVSLLVIVATVIYTVVAGPALLLTMLLIVDGLLLINYVGLFACYRREPAVVAYYHAAGAAVREEKMAAAAEQRIAAARRRNEALRLEEDRRQLALRQRREGMEAKERAEKGRIQDALHAATLDAENRRREIKSREEEGVSRHQAQHSPRINEYTRELDAINMAELSDLSRVLQATQEQFVRDYLRGQRIGATTIPGVRDVTRTALAAQGIVSADDIDYYAVQRVPGLTHAEAAALETWRQYRAGEAARSTPTRLSPQDIALIRAQYEPRRRVLQEQMAMEKARLAAAISAIGDRFRAERSRVDTMHLAAQVKAKKAEEAVADRYAPLYARITRELVTSPPTLTLALQALDDDMREGQNALRAHSWNLARARHTLHSQVGASLLDYAGFVYLPALRSRLQQRRRRP